MGLLEAALAGPNCVVSVMGDHAGEGADGSNRKKADINRLGKTFWLMRSSKARPAKVLGDVYNSPSIYDFGRTSDQRRCPSHYGRRRGQRILR